MKHTTRRTVIDVRKLAGLPVRKPGTIVPFPAPASCPLCVLGLVQRPVYCCQDASEARDNLCGCLGLAVDLVLLPCTCPAGVAHAERADAEVLHAAGAPSFPLYGPDEVDELPF